MSESANLLSKQLHWVLESPLISKAGKGGHCQWLDQKALHDILTLPTADMLDATVVCSAIESLADHRLGTRFEQLLLSIFEQATNIEVIAYNKAIHQDGRTLGAIDYILFDDTHKHYIHLEVAVKFYLGDGKLVETESWIGPGRKDHLARKIKHMQTRQCAFSIHPEIRKLIPADAAMTSCSALWGRLFYPMNQIQENGPDFCAANHPRGWWLRYSDFIQDPMSQQAFAIPDKKFWLNTTCDIPKDGNLELVRQQLARGPVLLCFTEVPEHMQWGFVVPDEWSASES